jgi:hypothetical protein
MTTDPTYDEISQRARTLWQERGQPSGQDDDIWFQAERELRGRPNLTAGPDRSAAGAPRTNSAGTSADSRPTESGRERSRQRRTQNA